MTDEQLREIEVKWSRPMTMDYDVACYEAMADIPALVAEVRRLKADRFDAESYRAALDRHIALTSKLFAEGLSEDEQAELVYVRTALDGWETLQLHAAAQGLHAEACHQLEEVRRLRAENGRLIAESTRARSPKDIRV